MREVEHESLFTPPEGTRAVVIPVVGEYRPKPPDTYVTPMEFGYARLARAKWKNIGINVGIMQWNVGFDPHPITLGGDNGRINLPGKHGNALPPKYHLISLPTRITEAQPIDIDYLTGRLRRLTFICDELPWLKEGTIVLPQICDVDRPWEYFKPYVEPWLSDRFVVISGRKGTIT
jgi:hypothetical protein